MDIELHVVMRILVAAALGAAIGLEREISDHPAGLRTHMTVALGAAMFGAVSTTGFDEFATGDPTNVRVDVTRVASTVVTAIGFVGAGVIFRQGTSVHNLTTAASLWVVAAVGLACGVGDIGPATIGAGILLAGLVALRAPRAWIRRLFARDQEPVRIVLRPEVGEGGVVSAMRGLDGIELVALGVEKEEGAMVITATVRAQPNVDVRERLSDISRRPDVVTLRLGMRS